MALIVLHELGHFVAAKAVGMRVERFSLFFPPKLFGVKRGETEYSIGAIPAGGYVKITGMSPVELSQLDLRAADRAYYMKQPWKRAVVILAGPAVNIAIAFILFWAVLLSGSLYGAATLQNLNESEPTLEQSARVAAVEHAKPASGVLMKGDRIVGIGGRRATPEQVRAAIASDRCAGTLVNGCEAANPVVLTVVRDGRTVTLTLHPRYDAKAGRMLIGFEFANPRVIPLTVFGAAGRALAEMWGTTTGTVSGLGRALTEPKERAKVSSIIGITTDAQETVHEGAGRALVFLGFISLVLGVMNLLPFLPLDGGHLLWSVLEKLRGGRRVSLAAMYRYSSVGIILLLFLVVSGVSNDISRLAG